VDGIEAQVTPKTLLAAYYGGVYVGRNTARDTTVKTPYPLVGYGNTAGTQNRDIQEVTFDWIQTLWKSKNYGALSLINQYSYIFRSFRKRIAELRSEALLHQRSVGGQSRSGMKD
jgi:hypothetical protein